MNRAYLVDALIKIGLDKDALKCALMFLSVYLDEGLKDDLRPIRTDTFRFYFGLKDNMGVLELFSGLVDQGVLRMVEVDGNTTKLKQSLLRQSNPLTFVAKYGKIWYFNPNWKDWTPAPGSLFYSLCNKLGLSPKTASLNEIVLKAPVYIPLDGKDAVPALPGPKTAKIVPYTLFEYFLEEYKTKYGKSYNLRLKERDLKWCRMLLDKIEASPYPPMIYTHFMGWVFSVKSRDPKLNPLSVGILPFLWDEYVHNHADKFMQSIRGTT